MSGTQTFPQTFVIIVKKTHYLSSIFSSINTIDRKNYISRFANIWKKPWKVYDLPMKYLWLLFLPKNDSFFINMLPEIENSVKNKENGEISRALLKIWQSIPLPLIFLLLLMWKKMRIRRPWFQLYRRVVHCFFWGIQVSYLLRVSVYTHQGHWLLQLLAFHGRILGIPGVVLAFAKTTKEFASQTPRIDLIHLLDKPRPASFRSFRWYTFHLRISSGNEGREFLWWVYVWT